MKHIQIQSSIVGFHNPKKHTGMSAEEFLTVYIRRQASLSVKGNNTSTRAAIVVYVLSDWNRWVNKCAELFKKTLNERAKQTN